MKTNLNTEWLPEHVAGVAYAIDEKTNQVVRVAKENEISEPHLDLPTGKTLRCEVAPIPNRHLAEVVRVAPAQDKYGRWMLSVMSRDGGGSEVTLHGATEGVAAQAAKDHWTQVLRMRRRMGII